MPLCKIWTNLKTNFILSNIREMKNLKNFVEDNFFSSKRSVFVIVTVWNYS